MSRLVARRLLIVISHFILAAGPAGLPAALFPLLPTEAWAQADGDPIALGTYRVLHSRIPGGDRALQIHLPTG